ncbi:MAG TPA: phosphoribosylaminoimidazolesuccinocarboxamide synthase [Thermoanaerobaculia bacterium]|nr:phosphoribosylaminoimidazolesuccinocarboxamide synthase [Thermoanaerobaculia bacterium]
MSDDDGVAVDRTDLPLPLFRRGKVRDVYVLGDSLLFIATDRISAFDVVLSPPIPGKGVILNRISNFWFDRFGDVENHRLETEHDRMPEQARSRPELRGRTVLARKCELIPIECVARGYLAGSGLREYRESGTVCGIPLEKGLVAGSRLPFPIFTPATKESEAHDLNISFEEMEGRIGSGLAHRLRELTLGIYARAAEYALQRGIIIADTKFEFGLFDGRIVWIDEALTPDSSRFWPAESHRPGSTPPSLDKQYVRDWLESTGWDKTSTPPELPPHVVRNTRRKYLQAYRQLRGV